MTAVPFHMSVEAGKIREFALAVRSADPEQLGAQPVSSPTFLASAVWWQRQENDPLRGVERDISRLLHGEHEMEFFGEPPAAGAELEGLARVDRTYEKSGKRGGKMIFTEVVTEFRDVITRRLVATSRSTTVEINSTVDNQA